MTPDRSHSDTVGRVANKVLILRSEISLFWRTSCARDFLNAPFFQFIVKQVFLINMLILLPEVMKWNLMIPVVPENQN